MLLIALALFPVMVAVLRFWKRYKAFFMARNKELAFVLWFCSGGSRKGVQIKLFLHFVLTLRSAGEFGSDLQMFRLNFICMDSYHDYIYGHCNFTWKIDVYLHDYYSESQEPYVHALSFYQACQDLSFLFVTPALTTKLSELASVQV